MGEIDNPNVMKSITLALENFSRFAGGAESYAVELSETLLQRGWEVHLVGQSWDGLPQGAVFHQISKLPKVVPSSLRILHFAFRHRSIVRKLRTDIVLGFGSTIEMNVYQSHGGVHFFSSLRKIRAEANPFTRLVKTMLTFLSPKSLVRSWIESAPFRMKNRPVIIAISDMLRDDICQRYALTQEDVELVYNGVDLDKFAKDRDLDSRKVLRRDLGFEPDSVLFLFMAYDFRKKGVKYLIQAAARLRNKVGSKSFGVVVVGSKPSPALLSLVDGMDLGSIVIFRGPTQNPETYYNGCDVFVLPTFYDACSLVVFEAMASGLPAITTRHNGASGIISDGRDGMVLEDPLDVAKMATAMERFLDIPFLETSSSFARQTASHYSKEANHDRIILIFESVLSNSSLT
jgi:UDP-glucose:(heptosyl)LPS alpha-1,3-glucosyltransferase